MQRFYDKPTPTIAGKSIEKLRKAIRNRGLKQSKGISRRDFSVDTTYSKCDVKLNRELNISNEWKEMN